MCQRVARVQEAQWQFYSRKTCGGGCLHMSVWLHIRKLVVLLSDVEKSCYLEKNMANLKKLNSFSPVLQISNRSLHVYFQTSIWCGSHNVLLKPKGIEKY